MCIRISVFGHHRLFYLLRHVDRINRQEKNGREKKKQKTAKRIIKK